MNLVCKSILFMNLATSFLFSQSIKKIERKAKNRDCPIINGSYSSCKIQKINIDLEGVGAAYYKEMEKEIGKFWDELPEEVQENLGIEKQQYIWVEILRQLKLIDKNTPTATLIALGSDLDQESFNKIYNGIVDEIKKIMKPDIEQTRKKEASEGRYDLVIETSWIGRKVQYSDNIGTYHVGEKVYRDDTEYNLTCKSGNAIYRGEFENLMFSILPDKNLLIHVQKDQFGIKESYSVNCLAE